MIYIGIDPGLSGAIACVDDDRNVEIFDVPTLALSRGGKAKREVDMYALARIFDKLPAPGPYIAVVERVGSMPGQGISSAFAFGKVTGALLMAVASQFIRLEEAAPQRWMREMAVPKGDDGSRLRASQLLPAHGHLWPNKKDHNRAEAALIALYAERLHKKPELST